LVERDSLQEVDDIGNEVGDGIVDDHVSVVVAHRVSGGRRRKVAVDIGRERRDVGDVGVGEESADDEPWPVEAIDGAQTAEVIAM
jgi:hypothetical protein